MGIQLISELEPKNSGSFALLDDKYIRGGLRVVETHDDLATIPTDRLKDGMLAMVTTPAKVLYIYNQPTNTWSLFSAGGEGGSVWSFVGDNETIKITQNVDDWTQTISAINNIRTYKDYSVLPTEDVADNEVAYCKADVVVGLTTHKRGFYYYDLSSTSWLEVNSTIEIDSALSETSKRPVQNRVVTKALDEKVSKDDVDNVISKYSENPIQNKAVATALEDVKNSKTMTAEEYDTLDDETKNDGSFYYISDTGEIYQNGIIYGGKQIFDVTQEEYDALTDEEKADNEYHCTDTGRVYINGILYGDKKPIELTFEEYKQLEADGLVEADVDYIITSDLEKGILLASEDVGYKDKTVHEALVTLEEDVITTNQNITKHSLPLVFDSGIINNSTVQVYKLTNVGYTASGGTDAYNLNLLLSSRGAEEIELIGGKNDGSWIIEAIRNNKSFNKITNIYQDGLDIYVRLDLRCNYFRVYHKSGVLSGDFAVSLVDTIPETVTELTIRPHPTYINDSVTDVGSTWSSNKIASEITNNTNATYLIRDIVAGGENVKTVSFKIRKDYFASYYAKRTFLLSANIYSLGFSKPVIGLVEIYRSTTDSYSGYVVNLQDTRYTGVTVTVNGNYLEVVVTFNSYESSGCMVSCSSLSNVPIA